MNLDLTHKQAKASKADTPIIFVHGAWHGAWCWEKFMEYFSEKGYSSYAFSFYGHGNSPSTKKFNCLTFKDYINNLESVVNYVGKSPIIIGHSMGGILLQKYLEKNTCRAAVLIASVPHTGVFRTTLKLIFSKWYVMLAILSINLYKLVNSGKKTKWLFFSDSIDETVSEECYKKLVGESFMAFFNMLLPNVNFKKHKKIPLLSLAAEKDRLFTLGQVTRNSQKLGADLIVIKNIAHNMMLENEYKQVADSIIEWLGKKEVLKEA